MATTSRVNDTYGDRNLVRARTTTSHAHAPDAARAPAHEPSTWHRCARARPSRRSSRRRTSSRRRCKRTRKYGQVHGAQDDLAMRAAGDRSAASNVGDACAGVRVIEGSGEAARAMMSTRAAFHYGCIRRRLIRVQTPVVMSIAADRPPDATPTRRDGRSCWTTLQGRADDGRTERHATRRGTGATIGAMRMFPHQFGPRATR